jgi:hypothetical protein
MYSYIIIYVYIYNKNYEVRNAKPPIIREGESTYAKGYDWFL